MNAPELVALSAPGEGRLVSVAGTNVHVVERGQGVPVVALHAIGHGGGDFAALAERFSARCRFFLVDWPGHGRSPASIDPSFHGYGALLAQLLPLLADEPVIVLGNSIGGAAAIDAAARAPERVRGVVLCDAGGLAAIGWFERLAIGALARIFEAGARGARWFPAFYRRYYALVLAGRPARERRAMIVAAGPAASSLLARAWRSFAEPSADLRALVERVRVPVWIAWAKRDRVIQWWASRAAAERFGEREISFFDAGHSAFLEDPDAFAAGFERFLDRVVSRARSGS